MQEISANTGLYTDFYEFTMAQGYFMANKKNEKACFDYAFRSNPFNSGYVVFAGLADLLQALKNFKFQKNDIDYLKNNGLKDDFIEYLSKFQFNGTIYSVKEGELIFPNEPVIRVEGNLIETQLIETILLNTINFQSLIATKACRIKNVAEGKTFIDFGLRRAQGLGGIHASKAAIQGGADATSNVYAGKMYGLNISGTQAHSWIQSFDNEYEAFKTYAENSQGKIILLADTYNTLKSGIPNVIKLATELKKQGKEIHGIRLDSGDLYYFSKKAREMLDNAGFTEIKIFVSNELDEYVIKSLNEQGAPVDGFGVGTRLITGKDEAALDGIYKLSMCNNEPKLKISENIEKITLPGIKKIIRLTDEDGYFYADAIFSDEEKEFSTIYHPVFPEKNTSIKCYHKELLSKKVMHKGKILLPAKTINEIKEYTFERLKKLPKEFKRFEKPHIYKVGISKQLLDLKQNIINDLHHNFNKL